MLERLSVKKPYTILVGVIAVIALGLVSLKNMSLDLLPSLSLPYLVVVTAYPGASPEKVESEVCIPLEQSLGTISGVKQVQSSCSENFGMVQLEFEEGTNIDSAMVKVSGALNNLEGTLPEDCGTPNVMEISMDMLASMYIAVSKDDADIYELTDYVKNDLIPSLERKGGVASITQTGLVEKTIQVDLNRDKIDAVNERILALTDRELAKAADQLSDARNQVKDAQAKLDEQEKQFGSMVSSQIFGQASGVITEAIPAVRVMIQVVSDRLWEVRDGIYSAAGQAAAMQEVLAQAAQRQNEAITRVNEAAQAVDAARADYTRAQNDYVNALSGSVQEAGRQAAAWFSQEGQGDAAVFGGEQSIPVQEDALTWKEADTVESFGDAAEEAGLFSSAQEPEEPAFTADGYGNGYPEPELPQAADEDVLFASNDLELRRTALEEASAVLSQAQEELAQASSEMNQTMRNTEAAASGNEIVFSDQDIFLPDQGSELNQLIGGLKEVQDLLNSVSVSEIVSGVTRLASLIPRIESALSSVSAWDAAGTMNGAIANANDGLASLSQAVAGLPELMGGLETAYAALTQGQLDAAMQFTLASAALSSADTQLAQAQAQYDAAEEQARENANMDSLLTASTLSQMIYAQNFAMPAGYIDDAEDNSWLLKVGDEYESAEELEQTLLADLDELGPVRLYDVADVTMIDNAGESFSRLNGDHAILLSIFKSPAAGTNKVAHELEDEFEILQNRDPSVHIVELMNQGSYIDLIIADILKSMLTGAALAFLVLVIFLRDIRPTVLVAISIPLSLLMALVLMYFTGLSLNIMTLAGLALGIGMLVDNSVVVMENIFRLRAQGVDAPRAAVQGARQVSGSIIASTLTTIFVFFPLVFTEGMVHELLVPMGLSIGFCLLASLITAMTVVPAAGSTILRKKKEKKKEGRSRILRIYEKTLAFCLKWKILVLTVSVGLLALTVYAIFQMGIVVLPAMDSTQIQVTVVTPEEDTKEESQQKAARVMDILLGIDGIQDVGIMDSAGLSASFGGMQGGGEAGPGSYTCLITLTEDGGKGRTDRICRQIEEETAGIDCEVTASGGGMSDLSALTAGNLSISIYGQDLDVLRSIGKDVAEVIGTVPGFVDINDGSQELDPTLHLVIDRDKAMALGITTAQIYMKILDRLTTSVNSTKIRYQGDVLDVVIHDETDPLMVENILDISFDNTAAPGMAAGAAGMSGFGGSSASGAAAGGMSLGSMDSSSLGDLASMLGMEEESQNEDEVIIIESAPEEEEEEEPKTHELREFAALEETDSLANIGRRDSVRFLTVTAAAGDGYNTTLLTRQLTDKLDAVKLPEGYSMEIGGESEEVGEMLSKMGQLAGLSFLFIYLIMVAQFQGLLSPMIVMFTIPLAFTGGMLGLLIAGRQLDMLSLMGFVILMGTVVNNGIVFVDYTNQLRLGGLDRQTALIAAGSTRMRPIMMTALTTILAMVQLIIGDDMGNQMMSGMALVIAAGLLYSTLMTLYVVPVMYDIFFKKQPLLVEVGDNIDDVPDDAAQYLAMLEKENR